MLTLCTNLYGNNVAVNNRQTVLNLQIARAVPKLDVQIPADVVPFTHCILEGNVDNVGRILFTSTLKGKIHIAVNLLVNLRKLDLIEAIIQRSAKAAQVIIFFACHHTVACALTTPVAVILWYNQIFAVGVKDIERFTSQELASVLASITSPETNIEQESAAFTRLLQPMHHSMSLINSL